MAAVGCLGAVPDVIAGIASGNAIVVLGLSVPSVLSILIVFSMLSSTSTMLATYARDSHRDVFSDAYSADAGFAVDVVGFAVGDLSAVLHALTFFVGAVLVGAGFV